ADRAAGVRQHARHGKVGLAGVGRAKNGDDAPVAGSEFHALKIGAHSRARKAKGGYFPGSSRPLTMGTKATGSTSSTVTLPSRALATRVSVWRSCARPMGTTM